MSAVGNLKKPQLRGLLHNQIRLNVGISIALCIVGGIATTIFVKDARKKVYADFYRTYDINKEFDVMRKKGVFDSCK